MSHFGRAKPKKGEKEDKAPYITYWIHSIPRIEGINKAAKRNFIKIISIDPATKTFAIRIEIRYLDGSVKPVFFVKWDLSDNSGKDSDEPVEKYSNLNRKLDEIYQYIEDANVIFIERQPPINYKSCRMMQNAITYFSIKLSGSKYYPIIYDVAPQLKGKILGAPPRISQYELKQWSVDKSKEILEIQGDVWSLEVLRGNKTKADDLADTVVQIEAMLRFWNHQLITKGLLL